jgi:hypothetical protein
MQNDEASTKWWKKGQSDEPLPSVVNKQAVAEADPHNVAIEWIGLQSLSRKAAETSISGQPLRAPAQPVARDGGVIGPR